MGLHTAEAIVLRRYPFRETSITLSCLTDQFGKLTGLIKGIRTQPNRYRSAMEPMTVNRIVFYDTRSSQLHLISQCELLSPFTELVRDLETARLAAFFVDLTETVVPLNDPHPTVYALLKHTLEHLALGGTDPQILRIHFIVRLLRLIGFQPQLDQCASCNAEVHAIGYWSPRQGGLLCERCLHEDPTADVATPSMLESFQTLAHAEQPPTLKPALIAGLRGRLDDFLRWRLDRPWRTLTT